MSCWTLWQRMPPRYQLTMRDIRTDDQDPPSQGTATATPSRVSSPKICTSRTGTRPPGSARRRRSTGEAAAVLTSGVGPEDGTFSEAEFSLQSPILPPRSSSYIHNMKNQMRINSARRKMHEGTYVLTSPTTLSYTPKPRATTAPAFPITDPSNTDQYHRLTSPRTSSISPRDVGTSPRPGLPPPQRGFSGKKTPQRPSSGVVSRRHVPIRTLCPFGQTPHEVTTEERSYRRSSPTQQDCVIGDYQVAALYVDNGRVTLFRKTKPDVTQSVYSTISPYNVTRDDGSYLSHLRKAYLSGVRDLPKLIPAKEPADLEKHSTIRERMDYDRKVGRILDYYSQVDVPTGLQQTLHQAPLEARQTRPSSPSFPAVRHAFRTPGSRRSPRVLATSEVRDSGSQLVSTDQGGPGGGGFMNSRGTLEQSQLPVFEDRGGFLSINAKARLHRRHQFYLRTPASPVQPPHHQESAEDCVCGMCRLEMEVALIAHLHQDLGVSVDAATAARIRSTLEGQSTGPAHPSGHTSSPDTAGAGDHCPARPNSVSESRRSAAPSEVTARQGMEPGTSASQLPTSGPIQNTATQTSAATEPTSLTVTLPAIEEVSDGTHVLQDSEVTEPNSTNPKAADTMERAVVVQNEKQEMLNIATDEELLKNSEQKVPDTIQMKDSVKNLECNTASLTDQDSVKTSEQPDTPIDKTAEKETPATDTDETSVKNSEHIKTDDASVNDSKKNSEQKTFKSDADENSVKNLQQETSNPLGAKNTPKNSEQNKSDAVSIDDSTVAEKPISSEEKEPEPMTDITEHENKLQSNTDANNPLLPDSSLPGSPSHSNPPADLTKNMTEESTSAEHDNVPDSSSEPESSTPCNHGGRTVKESSSNANAPVTNDNSCQKIHAGNQIPGDALACDFDAQATVEGGTAPAPNPSPGEAVISSTVGTVPEEDGGMDTKEALPDTPLGADRNTMEAIPDTPLAADRNTKEALPDTPLGADRNTMEALPDTPLAADRNTKEALPDTPLGADRNTKEALPDTPLECNPPTIVISLASDNEEDITNDETVHTST